MRDVWKAESDALEHAISFLRGNVPDSVEEAKPETEPDSRARRKDARKGPTETERGHQEEPAKEKEKISHPPAQETIQPGKKKKHSTPRESTGYLPLPLEEIPKISELSRVARPWALSILCRAKWSPKKKSISINPKAVLRDLYFRKGRGSHRTHFVDHKLVHEVKKAIKELEKTGYIQQKDGKYEISKRVLDLMKKVGISVKEGEVPFAKAPANFVYQISRAFGQTRLALKIYFASLQVRKLRDFEDPGKLLDMTISLGKKELRKQKILQEGKERFLMSLERAQEILTGMKLIRKLEWNGKSEELEVTLLEV